VARVDVGGRWGYIAKVRDRRTSERAADVAAAPPGDALAGALAPVLADTGSEPTADGAADTAAGETGVAIDLREPATPDVLVVHYQPILDLARGRVAAVEAFPRLRRDDGSLVGSAELVSAWERTGLAGRLGEVLLPRALGHLAELRSETGYEELRLFAEVSPHQLAPALVELVRTWLARFDLPADALLLEVTETAPIDTMDDALAVLRALHALGVGTALDDFGTGFTRLDLVPDLPIDTLKIDASFVRRVAHSEVDHEIVETIVSLARRRHLTVVAEGVETVEQVEVLSRLGCAQAQGDLFGRPTDVDQLRYLLREWSIVPAIATSRDR
jgi:EAL domain-containing protein (putative c-di-GMP-specific phosphodiesterase class I)